MLPRNIENNKTDFTNSVKAECWIQLLRGRAITFVKQKQFTEYHDCNLSPNMWLIFFMISKNFEKHPFVNHAETNLKSI